MKKEELLARNGELLSQIENLKKEDLKNRKEFALALGKYKKSRPIPITGRAFFSLDDDLEELSWAQIFIELGKLLSARNFYDFEGNLSEIESRLEDIEKR